MRDHGTNDCRNPLPSGSTPRRRPLIIGLIAMMIATIFPVASSVPAMAAPADFTSSASASPSAVDVPVSFVDVPEGMQFYYDIMWLTDSGLSTGWQMPDDTREFRPLQPIARDAMAAFLYRLAGSPEFTAPEVSSFTDVPSASQFYTEISWLESTGISTGWDIGDGTFEFRPLDSISRDAMAAFLYRFADKVLGEDVASFVAPAVSPFVDVPTDSEFFLQISWLSAEEISTGWDLGDGTAEFRDLDAINRDAMAAFIYRLDNRDSSPAAPLVVSDGGITAVWTANFGQSQAGRPIVLQKQTVVTTMTSEVTSPEWVGVASTTLDEAGRARLTVEDTPGISHDYRAVVSPDTEEQLVTDVVSHAAPHRVMNSATGLATVYIDTNEADTVSSKDRYWEARMTITPAAAAAGTTDTPCGGSDDLLIKIAGRGNYTWGLDKKPYKIGLDKKANLCGMGSGKKWALVANHYDRSLLRNTVALGLGQQFDGLAFTPDAVPVDVIVNGEYLGSYILAERVNIGGGRVADGDNELKDNQGGVNDQAPEVTGTYLLEWDSRAGGDHNIEVGDSGTVAIAEPEDEDDGSGITQAQISYIDAYLNAADQAIFSSDFDDPVTGWRHYIDEDSLVDWYIVQELTKNLDANLYTSCYMYKTRDTADADGKLYFGPIWDFDTSMGAAQYPAGQGDATGWYLREQNDEIEAKMAAETWINRLFEDPQFVAQVEARWKQVYPILTSSDAFVQHQSELIATSSEVNFERWDINERLEDVQVIQGSWEGEVSYLRGWLSARIEWMNGQLG